MYATIPELTEKQIRSFWDKVDIKSEDECWLWRGGCDNNGYGTFCIASAPYRAHRVSLAIIGVRSNKLMVLHDPITCKNRNCVNPKHLRLGTALQNGADRAIAGTAGKHRLGLRSGIAKLIDSDIPIIRKLFETMTVTELGKLFGVAIGAMSLITRNKAWTHVIGVASEEQVAEFLATGTSVPYVPNYQI